MLGGSTAWVVLAVGQFAAVITMLQRSSLGVAATYAYARFGIADDRTAHLRDYSYAGGPPHGTPQNELY